MGLIVCYCLLYAGCHDMSSFFRTWFACLWHDCSLDVGGVLPNMDKSWRLPLCCLRFYHKSSLENCLHSLELPSLECWSCLCALLLRRFLLLDLNSSNYHRIDNVIAGMHHQHNFQARNDRIGVCIELLKYSGVRQINHKTVRAEP